MERQATITAVLGVGAICATVAGAACSTNARIDDLHAELLDLRAEVRSETASVRGEIQDVRDEVRSVRDLLIDHTDGHPPATPDD